MPFANVQDGRIHYELSGPASAPVLVLSNSLCTNYSMWDAQMPSFTKELRVLRYDTRGHGQSSITPGPYSFEQLSRDVLALADELRIEHFAFCGLSMGGITGMWLGIHAPRRVTKLVLCSTGAKILNEQIWDTRIDNVRKGGGLKAVSDAGMERWFTARFRQSSPEVVKRFREIMEQTDLEGYVACAGALREADLRNEIAAIRIPTLVISGTHDPATPPADGKFIAEKIAGARYVELDASHLSNIEQAEQFTQEVARFLAV